MYHKDSGPKKLFLKIRKRQQKFMRHITRKESLEELTFTGEVGGKRSGEKKASCVLDNAK